MIANGEPVRGIDVPIVKLIPRRERKVGKKYYQRIEASLRAVGLIDPLIVFPQGDSYEILDGCLRYRILLELGIETVPCLISNEREGFRPQHLLQPIEVNESSQFRQSQNADLPPELRKASFRRTRGRRALLVNSRHR